MWLKRSPKHVVSITKNWGLESMYILITVYVLADSLLIKYVKPVM